MFLGGDNCLMSNFYDINDIPLTLDIAFWTVKQCSPSFRIMTREFLSLFLSFIFLVSGLLFLIVLNFACPVFSYEIQLLLLSAPH